jgi:protein-S-isoprenylcysteine O-methyltransferase Ste14
MRNFFEDIYPDIFLAVVALMYIFLNWKSDLAHILGASLAIISFILWIIARINLGRSFSVRTEAKELTTSGLYSKIRNPIYIFSALFLLGILIALEKIYLYLLLLILIIIQVRRARKEEKILKTTFGQKYTEYRSHAWF